jgi:glycosyltransferase involved in cell wall biosynthesis
VAICLCNDGLRGLFNEGHAVPCRHHDGDKPIFAQTSLPTELQSERQHYALASAAIARESLAGRHIFQGSAAPMRICIINPFYDSHLASFQEIKERYRHLELLPLALARRNNDVVVVQAFHSEGIQQRNSVEFRYVQMPYRPAPRLAGGRFGINLMARAQFERLIVAAADARPDAVHMIGVTLLQPLGEVGSWCWKAGLPLGASHHGGVPRQEPWLHAVQRTILRRCKAVFFTSGLQARPWLAAGLLREEQIVPCMEVSSDFVPKDRRIARARTGMQGEPIFVWNARLHPIKDPLTALKGFALIRERWPAARLYMIYLTDEMHAEVAKTIAENPLLKDAVEMRGRIARTAVEDFLNSADFIIQTSLREHSSYSILEAMSCGVIPVVTEIPSFRAMTGDGSCGILFRIGDFKSMAERTLTCDLGSVPALSQKVRDRFVEFLSYEAIARAYEAALTPRAA